MPSIGSTDTSTLLLLEEAKLATTDQALILSSSDPALVLAISRKAAAVKTYDESYSALKRLRQHIAARQPNAPITICDEVFPESGANYDVAFMTVPKGRDFARAQLWSALLALRPGGRLYIAGPTDGGAKSVLADASTLFGSASTLSYKRHYRIGVAVRPDRECQYPPEWGDDPTVMQERTIDTPEGPLVISTMPGVFSWQHLDDGTALLLTHLNVEPDQSVLDVGCGYGIIGIVAARKARAVTMIDDNLLAVRCARASAAANQCTHVQVQPGDVYNDLQEQRFDFIVSNPPFHKDFDVNTNVAHRLIRGAKEMLNSGGRVVIVANAFLKYEQVMAEHLGRSRVIARTNRFMVIEGRR